MTNLTGPSMNLKCCTAYSLSVQAVKKIRDENGKWNHVEVYMREHTDADFSHGLCTGRAERLYPGVDLKRKK